MQRPSDLEAQLGRIEAELRTRLRTPYLFVDEARRAAGLAADRELVYGATPERLMIDLLEYAGAGPADVFYDLGSGIGQCVLVASLFCARAIGVELLAPLAEVGQAAAAALGVRNTTFRTGDLRSADLSDGTLLFCYSTCLGPWSLAQLAARAATAAPGARILTVTHPLDHPAIELRGHRDLQWEDSLHSVYLHVRSDR